MTVWSPWSYAGGNGLRVGIDLLMTSSTNIQVTYYVNAQYPYSGDVMSLAESGAWSGTDSFTLTCGANAVVQIAQHNKAGNPGQTYTFGASISGAYNGSTPSVANVSITIPAVAPSTPGTPSVSSITPTSAHVAWSAPSNWGGSDWCSAESGRYDVQYATNSGFTTGVVTHNSGDEADDPTGLTPNTTYWVRVRAKNDSATKYSPWSSARTFTTLPNVPTAPGAPTITRTSDTQQTVAWPTNATSSAPYESQVVQRAVVDATGATGPFVSLATVSGTATLYADNTTAANRVYRYRIIARNAAGTATSDQSVWVHTTPTGPSNVSLTKTAAGDIIIGWTVNAQDPNTRTTLEHSGDGGANWSPLTTTGSSDTATYTHTTPGASTHTYRLQTVVSGGSNTDPGYGLASAWVVSSTIATAAPPNAPTNLSPSGVVDLDLDQPLTWQDNPTDGSPQSGFELRHRPDSGSAWTSTGHVTGSARTWTLPGGTYPNGTNPEYQVATWGQLTDAGSESPFSAVATLSGSSTPTVAISTPAGGPIAGSSSVSVAWAYFQAENVAQAAWRVTLLDQYGATLTINSGSGDTAGTDLEGLAEGDYTVRVEVRSADGLWATPAEVSFTLSYAPPAPINLVAEFDDESGAITLSLYPQTADGTTTLDQVGAYIDRSLDQGWTWTRITPDMLDPGAAQLDTTAPVDGTALYRVTGVSSLPSRATSDPVPVDTGTGQWGYLSCGVKFDQVVRIRKNLSIDTTTSRESALAMFEGRERPVLMNGTHVTDTLTVSGWLDPEASSPDDWRDVFRQPGPHLWRDPDGHLMYGQVSGLPVGERKPVNSRHTIQFTLTQVDH